MNPIIRWSLLGLGTLGLLVLAQPAAPSDDIDPFAPTATLVRKGKEVVAIKTSPDDKGVAYLEELELLSGKLEVLDAKTAKVGEKSFSIEGKSQIAQKLKAGDLVSVEYIKPEKADDIPVVSRLYAGETKGKSLRRFVYNDPLPYRVNVRFGKDARAFGALALVEQIPDGRESVRLSSGDASYIESEERLEVKAKSAEKAVEVQQGKSTVFGSRLDYENESGEADVKGPISLTRKSDKPLTGSAERMVYNVDDEVLRLFGTVQLEQDGRTTTASSAIVREKDRLAFLFGTPDKPVRSVNKDGFVEGTKLQYNLDTSDVVVLEGVKGEFQDK